MPRLVADHNPWHLSAARFCVGRGEHPSDLNGSCGQASFGQLLTADGILAYLTSAQQNGRGRQDRLFLPPLFPSFEKWARSRGLPTAAADAIALERTTHFGASAPGSSPQKTGAPTRIGAAVFILNG